MVVVFVVLTVTVANGTASPFEFFTNPVTLFWANTAGESNRMNVVSLINLVESFIKFDCKKLNIGQLNTLE
ncbi:hypothetical protein GCM10027049_15380 [Mucilaginibacter puniceus]